MLRRLTFAVALTAGLMPLAGPLGAQGLEAVNRHERKGFFIGFGFGYGGLSAEGADGTEGGVSGMLRIGGTLSQKLLIGVETNGWTKSEGGATLSFGTLTGAVQFYPAANAGFFLSGGAGLATITLTGFDPEYGLGVLLGLGYDARVGRNFSITPFLNGFASSIEGTTVSVGQLGVGVTFH
ncbi:MAG TPA: hypothetical protein VGA02_01025 [Gemmatimonadales bacterium]